MPETLVWIVRHGVSTFNLEGRCQGCSDEPELTPSGREAARLTGERLAHAGIEAIISSPLRRALNTALTIMDAFRSESGEVPFETDHRLREIELPLWEGLSFEKIRSQFPAEFLTWRLRPGQLSMPAPFGAKDFPVRNLYRRVNFLWRDLLCRHAGKSILLVTHGGTGRALINTALGIGVSRFHALQQSNCAISRIRFSEARAHLELLNDTAHLGDRLPKLKEGRTGTRLLLLPITEARPEDLGPIADVLAPLPIAPVLLVGPDARGMASRIFQAPQVSMEQVSEENLQSRVRQILATPQNDVRHVALLAVPDCLKAILREHSGLTDSAIDSLVLSRMGITALHFPAQGIPPVLQAINAFPPEFSFARVQL
jgi:broad specificity phosphatase PhoE